MDEMIFFRRNAILAELCKEWNAKWSACHNDKEKLMRLVLMQQSAPYFASFCYQGKGLTKEYCKREYAEYINGRVFMDCDDVEGFSYNMFIEPEKEVFIDVDVSQLLWCDNVDVRVKECKATTLYVSNKSKVNIICEGYNTLIIYLFDESEITLEDIDENTSVLVYRYSDESKVNVGKFCMSTKMREFRKRLKL